MKRVHFFYTLIVFLLSCSSDKTNEEESKIMLEVVKLTNTENFNIIDTLMPIRKNSIRLIKNRASNFNHFFNNTSRDYENLLRNLLFDKKYYFVLKNSKVKSIYISKIYYDKNSNKAMIFGKFNYCNSENEEIIFFFKKENNAWKICNQEIISISD